MKAFYRKSFYYAAMLLIVPIGLYGQEIKREMHVSITENGKTVKDTVYQLSNSKDAERALDIVGLMLDRDALMKGMPPHAMVMRHSGPGFKEFSFDMDSLMDAEGLKVFRFKDDSLLSWTMKEFKDMPPFPRGPMVWIEEVNTGDGPHKKVIIKHAGPGSKEMEWTEKGGKVIVIEGKDTMTWDLDDQQEMSPQKRVEKIIILKDGELEEKVMEFEGQEETYKFSGEEGGEVKVIKKSDGDKEIEVRVIVKDKGEIKPAAPAPPAPPAEPAKAPKGRKK
jgi:hypothetical protein